jgi:exoribonuclease R
LTDEGEAPAWAREALPLLPDLMQRSDRQAKAVDRACTDAVEAALLQGRVGEAFDAVVVDVDERGGLDVQLSDPPVSARATGEAKAGDRVRVTLVEADIARRLVRFAVA